MTFVTLIISVVSAEGIGRSIKCRVARHRGYLSFPRGSLGTPQKSWKPFAMGSRGKGRGLGTVAWLPLASWTHRCVFSVVNRHVRKWSPWRTHCLSRARVGGLMLKLNAKFLSILNYINFINFIYGMMMNVMHECSKKMLIVVLAIFGRACFGHLLRCDQHRVLPAGCLVSPLPGTDMLSAVLKDPLVIFWFLNTECKL